MGTVYPHVVRLITISLSLSLSLSLYEIYLSYFMRAR